MKTILSHRMRRARGYALLIVLSMAACCMILLTATMWRTATDSDLNARNNQWNAGVCAAEAATEKVLAKMRYDYTYGQNATVAANLTNGIYKNMVPTSAENPWWSNFQFSDGQGHANQTYVGLLSSMTYQPLDYQGLSGWVTTYRILSNVSQTTRANFTLTNAVQQDVMLESVPVFQFAIFYNGLLEFTTCATMTVNGRVHANSNLYYGSSQNLTFNGLISVSGNLSDPSWAGDAPPYGGTTTFNGGYITNVPIMELPIGTNNSSSAVYAILQMPPAGEATDSAMGSQRYYNNAQIDLLVSNSTVTAILKQNASDTATNIIVAPFASTNYSAVSSNFPFLSLTNYFYDMRENKIAKASQIDVGAYNRWLLTNSVVQSKFPSGGSVYPNILYLGDFRTDAGTTNGSDFYVVRLTNGVAVPTNGGTGFTVATPDPLYVWGNYNAPAAANQGSTVVTGTQPTSLISDALTILSGSWKDSASSNSSSSRPSATTTTVDAAIITGVVYSTGSSSTNYSGGVHNLPRLLENWSGDTLWLNTSIVNLFPSQIATNQFVFPTYYYTPPTREFSFNTNYLNISQLPPGTPMIGLLQKAKWTIPPPGRVTYNGY